MSGAAGPEAGGEAVVLGAEVTAGHDGEAELTLTVRFENGVVAPVVLDSEAGFEALAACGAAGAADLVGQPWRRVIAGLAR
ncbi:MAG: hypothetical protein RL588_1292 [Pseudomonadota bacterium]